MQKQLIKYHCYQYHTVPSAINMVTRVAWLVAMETSNVSMVTGMTAKYLQ